MAQSQGKFQLVSSDDTFDQILDALGVSAEVRALSKTVEPVLEFFRDGDNYTVKATAAGKEHNSSFTLGVEVEHKTADGRQVKSTFTREGNVLKQVEVSPNGKVAHYEREITPEGLNVTVKLDNLVAKRVYKRL